MSTGSYLVRSQYIWAGATLSEGAVSPRWTCSVSSLASAICALALIGTGPNSMHQLSTPGVTGSALAPSQ